jgi:hypothetical protein
MDSDVLVSLISAGLALISALASGIFATRANRQAHELERRRDMDRKIDEAERVLAQYRDPLLDAAHTLQGRLHNIMRQSYFARYLTCGDPAEEQYARDYTLFAIAEYLCWVEIVRRELRFLDVGDVDHNRKLLAHLTKIQLTFQTDRLASPWRVFRGRQRAIAEVMMVPTSAGEGPRSECMGYAAFAHRLHTEEEFASWFQQLNADIDVVARSTESENIRLIQLQRDLVDLIDFLDPKAMRVIREQRERLTLPETVAVPA